MYPQFDRFDDFRERAALSTTDAGQLLTDLHNIQANLVLPLLAEGESLMSDAKKIRQELIKMMLEDEIHGQ